MLRQKMTSTLRPGSGRDLPVVIIPWSIFPSFVFNQHLKGSSVVRSRYVFELIIRKLGVMLRPRACYGAYGAIIQVGDSIVGVCCMLYDMWFVRR